jgi:hypothetical protein
MTTGDNAELDDVIQFCCVPVGCDLEVASSPTLFTASMQMRKYSLDGKDLAKKLGIASAGSDPYTVLDVFTNWFETNRKTPTRKIMPLAYNWAYTSRFLIDWMGLENFNYIFDYRYRDLLSASLYCNDRSSYMMEGDYPYPKNNLTYICNVSNVTYRCNDDILHQAKSVLKCYKIMMSKFVSM